MTPETRPSTTHDLHEACGELAAAWGVEARRARGLVCDLADERKVLVGRTVALRLLRTALRQARAGLPRVVLVTGPAGVGKTALLHHFLHSAQEFIHGEVQLLRASGDELESRLPFGIVEQLCRGLERAGAPQLRGECDPLAVGAGLIGLFGQLEARSPLLVVVDEAHWADTPSLQALTFALRRLHSQRMLCVIAARDEAPNLPEGLRRLLDSERGVALPLEGLDAAELITLAARLGMGTLPRAAAERLRMHTGGNPLYARLLLEQLEPDALWQDDGPLPAPSSFSMFVLSRLNGCSVEAKRLVTSAAVLGPQCALSVAANLAGLSDPLPALEEAVGAGLLQVPLAIQSIAFPHPLIRAAVYHDLGPALRARLHAQAAALLDPPASLDHRVAAAIEPDEQLAAELAAYAAQEAARGAFASAAAHLEASAQLNPDRAAREGLFLESVELLLRGNEIAQVEARVDQVARLPDSARRQAVLGHLAVLTGRGREAEQLLAEAWERCDLTREAEVGARAGTQLAWLRYGQGRAAEAIAGAQRVRELRVDDPFTNALALSVLVISLAIAGREAEALALVAGLPASGPASPPEDLEGIVARGAVRLWTDDLTGARDDLLTITGPHSPWLPVRVQLFALGHLAEAEHRLGDWDNSVAHAEQAVRLAEDTDTFWAVAGVHAGATPVLAARGEWEAAAAHAQSAAKAAETLGDAFSITFAAIAAASIASAGADYAGVVAAVQPILERSHRDGLDEPRVVPWREVLTDALVSLGRLDEAETVLAQAEAFASTRQRRSSLAMTARLRGNLEAAKGNLDDARAAFEAGLRHIDGLPVPFGRALIDDAYGRFLRRAGERRAATVHLQAARTVYASLGAQPFLERCDRELAACGLSAAHRQPAQRLDLTPQEFAVASLVATGLTNRQVATQLGISAKTVEYHLSNVYAKLRLTSRTQLAAHLR